MTTTAIATTDAGVNIDYDAVLQALNLNRRDPKTQALLLVCDRYGLDPVLKHIVLISGNAYVTRDGYLAVAHRSGKFDGMEVLDEGETNTHYTAKVAVYRKDMGRPFTFSGRFPKSKSMAKDFGPEMAIKVAEVSALRRAFNVTGLGAADERWDVQADAHTGEIVEAEVVGDAAIREDADESGPTVTATDAAQVRTSPTHAPHPLDPVPGKKATVTQLNRIRKLVRGSDDAVAAKCAEILKCEVDDLFSLTEIQAITCADTIEGEMQ